MTISLGIDTGGTYTDAVLVDSSNNQIKAARRHTKDGNQFWAREIALKKRIR